MCVGMATDSWSLGSLGSLRMHREDKMSRAVGRHESDLLNSVGDGGAGRLVRMVQVVLVGRWRGAGGAGWLVRMVHVVRVRQEASRTSRPLNERAGQLT